jgi:hypothetical protein
MANSLSAFAKVGGQTHIWGGSEHGDLSGPTYHLGQRLRYKAYKAYLRLAGQQSQTFRAPLPPKQRILVTSSPHLPLSWVNGPCDLYFASTVQSIDNQKHTAFVQDSPMKQTAKRQRVIHSLVGVVSLTIAFPTVGVYLYPLRLPRVKV